MENRHSRSVRRFGLQVGAAIVLVVLGFSLFDKPRGASAAPGPTDLALTKTDNADPVTQGDTFIYTIVVKNQGTNDATDVVVIDDLPSQVDYVSAASTAGTCQRAGSKVTCTLGQLDAGLNAQVTITVKADNDGTASNTATVTTTVVDPDATNNQATQTTVINKKTTTPKTKKQKKSKGASCAAPTIIGTAGNDALTGTRGGDVIASLGGDDRVSGLGGKDLICTGPGADFVSAGPGGDTVIGGGGPDSLFGNTGDDLLKGKSGRDRLRGNAGDDFLNGGRGRDSCRGGSGNNVLRGCR